MEPLSTMIGAIVSFLGTKLSNDKSIDSFFSEFTEATVNWIKPYFLKKDGTEKKVIKNLKEAPESCARKKEVETVIEKGIEDTPEAAHYIEEIFETIQAKDASNFEGIGIKAKDGIDIKAEQVNSKATFNDLDGGKGKINIDIKQK